MSSSNGGLGLKKLNKTPSLRAFSYLSRSALEYLGLMRTLFAFDPTRSAILLIGGDKTGDNRFYERLIPEADRLYSEHLEELKDEGLL